jgi:RNA polymerase-binding transcription factor DksA
MTKSKRVMRRLILSKLYDSLQDQYTDFYSRDTFINGELTFHQLDALLAFKSDPQLEDLRHALDRLEDGSYGICLSCKSSINQELLDDDPTQRVCSSCEQKFIHVATAQYFQHHLTT